MGFGSHGMGACEAAVRGVDTKGGPTSSDLFRTKAAAPASDPQRVEPLAGEQGLAVHNNRRSAAVRPVVPVIDLSSDVEMVRFATILFADIAGSTRLISSLDPEDARDLLDHAIGIIQAAIHAFDGLVVRVQGDGVMAVFGVQPAVEDHAMRAALAGQRIAEAMRSGEVGVLPAPQVRVGIHSGPVLLRRQDNDFGSILDVVGHAAHVAGQIEKMAPAGSTAISATALALIAEPCEARPAGTLVSGADERGEAVFELVSITFSGSDRVQVKGDTTSPIIGRDNELQGVRMLVQELARGKGTTLGIAGEAGMGKSRLLLEAARHAAGFGVTFVAIRGSALLATVPFGCLTGPVRHLLDLLASFMSDPAREAGLTALQAACLEGLAMRSDNWLTDLAPGDRSAVATQTVVRLLALAGSYMPLLLLVDDVQYIDAETLAVLQSLRPTGSLAMIVAGRPEALGQLVRLGGEPLQLQALGAEAARSLVVLLNRVAPMDEGTVQHIVERAEGLPLALHEFAAEALSTPDRADTDNAGDGRLPARLDALLAARFAALDVEAARLAQFCAVLGPSFTMAQLQQGAAQVCRNPGDAIARLVAARVIAFAGTGQVRFTHQLVQEAAYRTMARRRRRAMHARALDLLSLGLGSDAASHSELAMHAEKADLPERAIGHLWSACEQAIHLAAIEAVRQLHERVRAVAARLEPGRARFEQARFALLAFDALQQLSLEQVTRPDMEAIATGAVELGGAARTVALINMALLDWIDGAPVRGMHWLAKAEALLDQRESLPRRTFADLVGAYLAYCQGDAANAIMRIERIGYRLEDGLRGATFGAIVVIPHVLARAFGAWYLADLGETGRARTWVAEALSLSRRHRHAYSRLLADLAHGYLLYRTGRRDSALRVLRRAHADCLRQRFLGFEPASVGWLALCLIDHGLLDEADTVLSQCVERGHFRRVRTSATYYVHEARTRLALAQLALTQDTGAGERAAQCAAEALEHVRSCQDRMHEAHALVLCAEVKVATGLVVQGAGDIDREALAQSINALGLVPLGSRLARLPDNAE